jgi:hypothetical protein
MRYAPLSLLLGVWLALIAIRGQAKPFRTAVASWAQVQAQGSGTVTALWNRLEPFMFRDAQGRLRGVEYESMQAFAAYLHRHYGVHLQVQWREEPDFDRLLDRVAHSQQAGVFGWGSYSITPARARRVRFTPPYMPDVNVLVTHEKVSTCTSAAALRRQLPDGAPYSKRATTMLEDMQALGGPADTPLRFLPDDFAILQHISENEQAYGYLPLSVYVVGLQQGLAIKRHPALTRQRPGCAGIYPLGSDWQPVVEEYFGSAEFGRLCQQLHQKYLGSHMAALIATDPTVAQSSNDRELLRLEKEIVSQRFIEAAVREQRNLLNHSLAAVIGLAVAVAAAVLLGRAVLVNRFNRQLRAQNTVIGAQNAAISRMNRQLEQKVLQGQMNPHFIFNSLNAIQYFVSLDEKRQALGYIAAFARFMRQLLSSAAMPTTTVAEEIRLLEQYLALEQQRFAHKFSYAVNTPNDDPGLLTLPLPPLLLHPFVEHALYHRVLNRTDAGGYVRVELGRGSDGGLQVLVEDNGAPRTSSRRNAALTPFARLADDRLNLLNESLAPAARIRVHTTDLSGTAGSTSVLISFPAPILEPDHAHT